MVNFLRLVCCLYATKLTETYNMIQPLNLDRPSIKKKRCCAASCVYTPASEGLLRSGIGKTEQRWQAA